jgi:hypothetical protein
LTALQPAVAVTSTRDLHISMTPLLFIPISAMIKIDKGIAGNLD